MIGFILGLIFGMAIMGTALMIYIGIWDTVEDKKKKSIEEPYKVHLRLKQRIIIIDEMEKSR